MFQSSPDIILIINTDLSILFLSQPVSGLSVKEAVGKNIFTVFMPDKKDALARLIQSVLKTGKSGSFEHNDSSNKWWMVRIVPIMENGATNKIMIVSSCITKKKHTEIALRESEEHHRALFLDSPINAITVDHRGRVTGYNKQREGEGKKTKNDRLPNIGDRMYTDDFAGKHTIDMLSHLKECIRSGKLMVFPELAYKKKYLSVNISPYPYGAIITSKDITARRNAEEKKKKLEIWLRQTQKLEAVGTLASGIAHEFNNILWIINGNIELAVNAVPKGNPARYHLEQVENACVRAKDMVMQIIGFTGRSEQKLEPLNIGLVTKEFLRFLRSSLPTTIKIKQNISAEEDRVMADLTQINQMLMNLCSNSYHSMKKKGGVLEINVLNIDLDLDDLALYGDLSPGKYLLITITDTGQGIKPEIMEKIFDPFFTTKSKKKSNGMGLAMVHGIVKNHGGVITTQSNIGKGTVFNVFLPCIQNDKALKKTITKTPPTGNEKILFVDDDKAIVDAGKRILERMGYRVSTATGGIEALKFFSSEKNPFDLIITDMTMPDLTGVELAKKIFSINPDASIVLCTGYSTMITPARAKNIGFKDFLLKPVTKHKIAETIRNVIDKSKNS